MGKNLIQQKRGKGTSTYRAPSFRYAGKVVHHKSKEEKVNGQVEDLIHCQGHSAPLMIVKYNGESNLMIAPSGVRVGQSLSIGKGSEISPGNTISLGEIPEGTAVYNIESKPGDGGKFVRSSGVSARVVSKSKEKVVIRLPSKKLKEFSANCLATIGMIAGSGRTEKPLLRAGNKYYKMKAKNKLWPQTGGTNMNAVDHPFGSKSSHTKGRPTQAPRNAPPGRKVGKIAPKRTGRKNR